MPVPPLATPADHLRRDGVYIQSHLQADPETAALANVLETAQEGLIKAIGGLQPVDTAAIMAAAVADFRLNAVQRAIVAFGTKCFGHFGSRQDPGYLLVYPVAPSSIAHAAQGERAELVAKLRKAATSSTLPKELAPAAKVLVAAIDEWTAGDAAAATANDALEKANKTVAMAADAWQTAVRKLRGKLIDLFPRDIKRQRSYFPPAKPAKKPPQGPA